LVEKKDMRITRIILLTLFAAVCGLAHAQAYPTKTITLVVAYPPGGQADALARSLVPVLQSELGQTVVVENVPGVGGSIGAQKVLAAPADGHTLIFATPIELVQTPLAIASAKYKPEDFRMIGPLASTYMMMIVRPDLPVANVAEFVSLAKKPGPKQLSYGTVGRGSAYHLISERFAQETGIQMLHVPYKGSQQTMLDLAGSQLDMAFLALGGPVPGLLQSGKFKSIGYTGHSRHPAFPNVPTLNESGLVKEFNFDLWAALVAPRGVPEPVLAKLTAAMNRALQQPQLRKDLEATGVQPADPMDAAKASAFYASEIARYQRIANSISLQPE
jgi:tripartite-type tricarboxylate transporter receptor subunit TctC